MVGDDGSTEAAVAVGIAAAEANLRGEVLHVVRAWSITSAVRPQDVPFGTVASLAELQTATLAFQEHRVQELLEQGGGNRPAGLEVHVVHGAAAKTLLTASETVDLLVVAARGVGGFRRLLLGSVADQCVRYAKCSVLVARESASATE